MLISDQLIETAYSDYGQLIQKIHVYPDGGLTVCLPAENYAFYTPDGEYVPYEETSIKQDFMRKIAGIKGRIRQVITANTHL